MYSTFIIIMVILCYGVQTLRAVYLSLFVSPSPSTLYTFELWLTQLRQMNINIQNETRTD